MLLSNTWQA